MTDSSRECENSMSIEVILLKLAEMICQKVFTGLFFGLL